MGGRKREARGQLPAQVLTVETGTVWNLLHRRKLASTEN